jgi:TP901 family phage tail tape measure protein
MAKADVAAGRAYVSIYAKTNELTKALNKAKAEMQKFGSEMMSAGKAIGAAGLAGLAPLGAGIKVFANFDDAMRMVKAVTQSTDADFAMLSATAKMLGATTSFTAVEVASLMTELGRAGFTAKEIDVMTAAVMDMSRATGTDAALSAGILSASLRQFKLGAEDATRVADVLTKTANSTFNTVESLGESMKYAGPVANELGLSLEDTAAILGTLGNAGIQGSEAGTALRRLGVITAATGKELKETFGISNVDASGNLKPIVQILDEIGKVTDKLSVEQKVTKMAEAFGLLGITSASVLAGTATETVKLAEALNNAGGTASKAAKEMDAGIGGAFRIILSAVEGVAIALGEAVAEPLKKAVEFGSNFLTIVVKLIEKNKSLVVTFGKIAAFVAAAGAAIVGIGVAFSGMAVVVGGFSAAISFAVTVLGAIGSVIGAVLSPVGLLTVALVAGTVAFFRYTEVGRTAISTLVNSVTSLFGNLRKTVTDTFGGIAEAIQAGDLSLAGQIAMVGLQLVFQQGLEAINNLFGESLGKIIGQLLSGDFAGAWATTGSVVLDTWAGITQGLVSLMTMATNKIADLWADTVNKITNQILQLASQGGIFGELFESISGVDMQAETARAAKLEAERRKLGLKPQTDGIDQQIANGTYKDPGVEAIKNRIKAITADIDAGMASVTAATGQAVTDAAGNQAEQTSANIQKLQEELARLRAEAKAKIEAGKKNPDPTKPEEGKKTANQSGSASGSTGPSSVATNNLLALQSAISSPQAKQVKLQEEQNKKSDKQIMLLENLLASNEKLGLYHA